MNYYKYYAGDFMRDTAALSLIEVGVYQRLLNFYYSGGVLPASLPELFRICAAFTNDEQNAVKKVVAFFFKKRGDFIINLRVEKELQIANDFIKKQSEKGKLRHKKADNDDQPRLNRGSAVAPAAAQPIHIPYTNTINNINTGKSASPVLEEKPNFTDVRNQLANGMTFKATRGISKAWQEEAFRYADGLKITLNDSQKGRWLKFFKDAHTIRPQMRPKIQIAFTYLSDLHAFTSLEDSEAKIKFFWEIAYNGTESYKNKINNFQQRT